jgi:hypothetical protein
MPVHFFTRVLHRDLRREHAAGGPKGGSHGAGGFHAGRNPGSNHVGSKRGGDVGDKHGGSKKGGDAGRNHGKSKKGRDSGGNHGDSKNGHAGGKHGSSKRVGTPALNRAARKRATMPVVSEVSLLAERVTPFPTEVIIANAMMAPERDLATITRRRVATLPLQAMLLGELAVTAVQLVTA